jgi:hypothetical protein
MEMGTLESGWSTSGEGTNVSSDTTTPRGDISHRSDGEAPTTVSEVQSPVDGVNNAQAPPLPPRPVPTVTTPDAALLPATQSYGPHLGPILAPLIPSSTPAQAGAAPLHVEVTDIPPPAYESQTTPGPSASVSQLRSPTQPGSALSVTGTMDFDSFMRAQQYKMEYKLMLERTGQNPPSESPGEMGPGDMGSGSGSMWGTDTELGHGHGDRQGTWAAAAGAGWTAGLRETPRGGGESQRRRRGSL